ncbi:hypothetical protein EV213_106218 [Aureibacillus halotolerans]|uniref:Uncharacterized protein n=1 Tax=Aureibacillus halotolerans TaxID=1508390 RepID=A0A4R6U703_9BACI|nr:hypothetical protein EV213_106218 [Aureibacillus halotolerans]
MDILMVVLMIALGGALFGLLKWSTNLIEKGDLHD